MKPQPQVSWEGDGKARNSRSFFCALRYGCNPPRSPLTAFSLGSCPGLWEFGCYLILYLLSKNL